MVDPPHNAPRALLVTLKLDGRPVAHGVSEPGERLLPDTPVDMVSEPGRRPFQVRGADGVVEVAGPNPVQVREGRFEVELSAVPRFRLPRFGFDEDFVVLPYLIAAAVLLATQLTLLSLLWQQSAAGGDAGFEPTPEYLARLLRGDTDGAEEGVVAKPEAPRPAGEKIEGFYLPSGHAGPVTRMGGGANVGRETRIGSPKGASASKPPPSLGPGGDLEVVTPAADAAADGLAEADLDDPAAEEGDDQPIAVHVNEGWGLSDWYDTEDAREDAEAIEQQLRLARQILRIDPDHPTALMVRSYYEYLAMDYEAAEKTYRHFQEKYPEEPAGWNNLALVYKRRGDYTREEELYRIALELAPNDDHALLNLALCLGHQGRFPEAWAVMEKVDRLKPGDPYAELHRAKLYAAEGKKDLAYRSLQRSLAGMRKLDTLHNIEFRQDIRLDPTFEEMRGEERFRKLLTRYYGDRPEGWWQKLRP